MVSLRPSCDFTTFTMNDERQLFIVYSFCVSLAFVCHDQGCSCILYAPQHQSLISAGKKGFVSIFDVRQRQERHRFQAHETATKCLALDPAEEFIVTGSADGDIKVKKKQKPNNNNQNFR